MVADGNASFDVARLMVRPVCPQLRKCRVRPGSYAWCQKLTSRVLAEGLPANC
jgi:hypothetical protein